MGPSHLKKRQGSRGKRIRRLRLDDSCFSVLSCPSFTVIDHGDGCSFLSLWAGERAPLFLHGGPRLQTGRRSIETMLIQAGIHHPDQKNRTTRPGLVPLKNTQETKKGLRFLHVAPFCSSNLARRTRFELVTFGSVVRCSIQLSYRRAWMHKTTKN